MKEKEIPAHVSAAVIDAWICIPPCSPSYKDPYCHVDCPYFYECNPDTEDDAEDDPWPMGDELLDFAP